MSDLPASSSWRMVCDFTATFYMGLVMGVIVQISKVSVIPFVLKEIWSNTLTNFIIFLILLILHCIKFSYLHFSF